jgi:hypothetical protein
MTVRMRGVKIPIGSPSAEDWARAFVETWRGMTEVIPPPDERWMVGWFANAMMSAHDYAVGLERKRARGAAGRKGGAR